MPRSRSMSIESRYCARMSRGSTAPVSSRIRSARVDLPWSMWAMIERLRIPVEARHGAGRVAAGHGPNGTAPGASASYARGAGCDVGPVGPLSSTGRAARPSDAPAQRRPPTGHLVANIKSQIKRNQQNEKPPRPQQGRPLRAEDPHQGRRHRGRAGRRERRRAGPPGRQAPRQGRQPRASSTRTRPPGASPAWPSAVAAALPDPPSSPSRVSGRRPARRLSACGWPGGPRAPRPPARAATPSPRAGRGRRRPAGR